MNHKGVHRIYGEEELALRTKRKKKRPSSVAKPTQRAMDDGLDCRSF